MAKWANAAVLQGGLLYIKNNATKMVLVSAYTAGDSYATLMSNALAEADMASGDFTIASNGNNQRLTTAAGKSATASATAGSTPDLHVAFTNGTSTVLWVTDETSNQSVNIGNTVNFPQFTYDSNQPT